MPLQGADVVTAAGTVHSVVMFYLECQNGVIISVRQKRGGRGGEG